MTLPTPVKSLEPLEARLESCLYADRHRLRRRLRRLHRAERDPAALADELSRLEAAVRRSEQTVDRRRAAPAGIEYPAELPVAERVAEIAAAIDRHPVVVLCGETGSGKSTQLPKICLEHGRGIYGRIGHTQPRRIAARSLAQRIAGELGEEVGASVGYKVRFADQVGETSRLKLMTDGILLAEIQRDRWLNEYDTLIVDEAHERSLNIDFLLGYLSELLPKRPELKLIITSATIDPQRFSQHFDGAPILEVSGRTYPVETRYRPPEEEGAGERDEAMQQAIVAAVDELSRESRGDVLVFLSGEREIRDTADTLRRRRLPATEILPLYARLGVADQGRIFRPSGQRRIVLSTNVAETSLTVPGIKYVIDTGFARISRYSARSKIQRLPIERISRASADQRKGRCGRVSAGVCIRLYSEEDFNSRSEFTEPEILRTNLASVILQMQLLGFGDIARFPFVEPPDNRQIKDGYRLLHELGAVDGERRITRVGRQLARLPVDPRVGRMLLEAAHNGCLREVLVIGAALSVQDPRDRPLDKQQAADEAHVRFKDEDSDFVALYKLWLHLEEQRQALSRRRFRDYCHDHFLSWTRVQEWYEIHRQLRHDMQELGYRENQAEPEYAVLHSALLSGLLSHIGFKQAGRDRDYLGARNTRFRVFPGSGLFEKQPKWLMAAELVETAQLYARVNARIQPEWAETLAGHLVKRSYSEPHWQGRRGQVGAYEKVTLYGLTLIPRRRVNYGPIDPETSRELFIRFGLVEGDFHSRAPFWRHNRELIADVHALEAKSRRRDILVDEEAIYAFYDQRIPSGVYSTPKFDQWLRKATRETPRLLHLREQDLMRRPAGEVTAELFPDQLVINGTRLPLEYHFEPGGERDGVTLVVPAAVLNQIDEGRADWLVPGLLREKIIALIKGLPKSLRRNFVPAPDYADRVLERVSGSAGRTDTPLVQRLGAELKRLTGVHVPEDAWDESALPDHLRLRLRVIDAEGRTLAANRDLHALRREHAGAGEGPDSAVRGLPDTGLERDGLTDWDFGELPEQVAIEEGGIRLQGFPALVDDGDSVAVRVLDSRPSAELAQRAGLRRLIMLRLAKEVRYLRRNLPALQTMRLQYAKAAQPEDARQRAPEDLEDEIVALVVDLTFVEGRPPVRDRESFERRIAECRGRMPGIAAEACELIAEILSLYQQLRKTLSGITQIHWLESAQDMQAQLDGLVYRGFPQRVGLDHLRDYPRFLQALRLRVDKLRHAAGRDRQRLRELQPLEERWRTRTDEAARRGRRDPRLEEIGWMLQELRVSCFAQELKTAYPVSLKRIEKRWRDLGL